jgi:hypothetical protein
MSALNSHDSPVGAERLLTGLQGFEEFFDDPADG